MITKRVFLTGATGLVGSAMVKALLDNGYKVTVLKHNKHISAHIGVDTVIGDITNINSWVDMLPKINIIINLVGIISENKRAGITFEKMHILGMENMIKVAKLKGVKRFLHISAAGAKNNQSNSYQFTKYMAEELLKTSGLRYTIIRSASIFGTDDKFLNLLMSLVKRLYIFPIFGNGRYKLSPISATDVAMIFVTAIKKRKCYDDIFHIQGSEVYEYNELIRMIASKLNRDIKLIHLPLWIVKIMAKIKLIPISSIQLDMLVDGDTSDDNRLVNMLDIHQLSFESYLEDINHK